MIALWLPLLVSAVVVYLLSSVMHMVLRHHRTDFSKLPSEATALEGFRKANVPPGDYFFPCPDNYADLNTPEMQEKFKQGPVGYATVLPSGPWTMGTSLAQWAVYCVAISAFVAYLASRTLTPGTEFMQVFRVAGTLAFLGYSGAQPVQSIWSKRRWSTTWKHVADGLVYALATGLVFAFFWPES